MSAMMNSGEVQARIDTIDATLAEFKANEERDALASISGDQKAVERLAANRAEGERLAGERALLVNALAAAQRLEAETLSTKQAELRAAHRKSTREAARALLPHAARVDEMLSELRGILVHLAELERAISTGRAYAEMGHSGRTNTSGLADTAIDQFVQLTRPVYQHVPPMVQIMEVAFEDLLADETEEA